MSKKLTLILALVIVGGIGIIFFFSSDKDEKIPRYSINDEV